MAANLFSIFQRKPKKIDKQDAGFAKVTEDGSFYLDFNDRRTQKKVARELEAIKDIPMHDKIDKHPHTCS